jgi:hypothetical protein
MKDNHEKSLLQPLDYQRVTDGVVKGALLRCKTCPFTHQKMPFCNAKGHLLERKRA